MARRSTSQRLGARGFPTGDTRDRGIVMMGNKGKPKDFSLLGQGCSVLLRLRPDDLGSDKTDTPYYLPKSLTRRPDSERTLKFVM